MTSSIPQSESAEMGRVMTTAKITNLYDLLKVNEGLVTDDTVRSIEVELLVDTGATMLSLPKKMIDQLGLTKTKKKRVITANGEATRSIYDVVRLEIMDRDATIPVMEVPPGVPALLGYVPLEMLDLVPNPKSQRLMGNPDHDGHYILDQL